MRIGLPYNDDVRIALISSPGAIDRIRVTGFPMNSPGFGAFRALDKSYARWIGQVQPQVSRSYFNSLTPIDYILCYESDLGWIGYPWDKNQAKEKINYERPVVIENVSDNQMFDVVTARCDSMKFWYDGPSENGNAKKSHDLRMVFEMDETSDYIKNRMRTIGDIRDEEIEAFSLIAQNTPILGLFKKFENIASTHKHKVPGQPIEENWKVGRFKEDIRHLSFGFVIDEK